MALVKSEILRGITTGEIIISPFRPEQLNNASYNVRIAEDYYTQCSNGLGKCINPFNKSQIADMWVHTKASDGFILIDTGDTVMCHTVEFIGPVRGSVPMLKSRSSIMRSCLSVAGGAGWGDVGYTSRWAFTITNNSTNDVMIPVGSEVAQIIFLKVDSETDTYNGSYQDSKESHEEHMANWHHSHILPKPSNS